MKIWTVGPWLVREVIFKNIFDYSFYLLLVSPCTPSTASAAAAAPDPATMERMIGGTWPVKQVLKQEQAHNRWSQRLKIGAKMEEIDSQDSPSILSPSFLSEFPSTTNRAQQFIFHVVVW